MPSRPRILLSRRWPEQVEALLEEGYEVARNVPDRPMSAADMREALRTVDAFCPTVTDRVDAGVLGASSRKARIIANYGVGFEHIDLAAARRAGIVVTNTPDVLTDCTADLALALILSTARGVVRGDRLVRAGDWAGWSPASIYGNRVSGKALGLVGFGRIARAVARRAVHGFSMRVLVYTPRPPGDEQARSLGVEICASLDELLARSVVVSLHCPVTPETAGIIGRAQLARMRRGAILINTARGALVDENALTEALLSGRLAGAGLDVYAHEPEVPEALRQMDQVVLLPHLGSATVETREAMGMRVKKNLDRFFAGREPPDRVA
ncbi:MAG: D-glycerate dehydrogenase [Gammaproteobacteria bacterium]|nr:D-glycerate dehydrogenase [Gammaproteobacteria bacterium]MXW44863.1 D-glycerate dehydrogenase [Gammaproteobacteria bacterium]MYD02010.1 D-glycerate dehydrogenase [Gammaproteobacteria bacterium]MYI24059.1 D-glycerate dehydrogenase [Gammaproteobacteria bacterium]